MKSSIVFLLSICLFAEAIVNSLVGIITHPSTAAVLYSLEAEVVIDILVGIGAVLYWFSSKPDYSVRARPLGIAILAAQAFLIALVLVIEGLILLLLPIIGILGLFIAALGFGFYKLGRGLWDGKPWAREILLILTIVGAIVSLALVPFYPTYGAPILALYQFWYLRRPYVSNYFQEYDYEYLQKFGVPPVMGQSLVQEWSSS